MLKALMEGKEGSDKICRVRNDGHKGQLVGQQCQLVCVVQVCSLRAGSPRQQGTVWIWGGNPRHPCAGAWDVPSTALRGRGVFSTASATSRASKVLWRAKTWGSLWIPSSSVCSVICQMSQLSGWCLAEFQNVDIRVVILCRLCLYWVFPWALEEHIRAVW